MPPAAALGNLLTPTVFLPGVLGTEGKEAWAVVQAGASLSATRWLFPTSEATIPAGLVPRAALLELLAAVQGLLAPPAVAAA